MKKRSRGAALLTAMLTVALVATFAAAALWQQWRSIEVETAERARVQASWILTGGLDWARLILREDQNRFDHLGEPWAVPLEEARLSSFLAADRNATVDTGAEVLDAFLSGQIIDLQSLLNVGNLLNPDGTPAIESGRGVESFARLFDLLGLPREHLDRLAENLRFASDRNVENRSASMAPLRPQQLEQLVWLGIPAQTVAVLQPYVTMLPIPPGGSPATVNLNTAAAEVIYASTHSLSLAEAQLIVTERERAPFRNTSDVAKLFPGTTAKVPENVYQVGVASNFFEIRSRLRLEKLVVEERSVVERRGREVKVLQRERGIVDPTALSRAAK
jgi:general secretion pathway protein K